MSKTGVGEKVNLMKNILKELHAGASLAELKERFRDVLRAVSPLEIPIIEQELVKEGIPVSEILKLCDLHVELFREALMGRELTGIPRGHPVDLLIRENDWILKQAEALGVYSQALLNSLDFEATRRYLEAVRQILVDLKKLRLHYRKVQMLIFPYLERAGIVAVPRVLWGREDQVIVKLRAVVLEVERARDTLSREKVVEVSYKLAELAREISELVFRENKILFPAVYKLLPEGAWAAIDEVAREMGYIVDVGESEWRPSVRPLYPYEWEPSFTVEQLEDLPEEFKALALKSLKPDTYRLKREGDLEFETGFLALEEVEGILRSLPLELTYADVNGRVRFYSESDLAKGFVRAKTILGRRIAFCHPPRLENYVMQNVNALMRGEFKYREFWTRQGERIIRVIVAPVKNREGKILGVLEIVEDLTEVVERPDEVKKKIMVL